MPNRDGSSGREQIDASMAGTILDAPPGMRFNDVVSLVTTNGVEQSVTGALVGDDDGDALVFANTSVSGSMKATWYDGDTVVTSANLGNQLASCGGSYTLKLEIPTAVTANTTYGLPNSNLYGTSTGVTYMFMPADAKIFYFQPLSMQVYHGTAGTDLKYASGYISATWQLGSLSGNGGYQGYIQTGGGFKKLAGFPTTGFQNAVFSVVGSGSDQSKYRCSSIDDGGKISLSGTASTTLGANCKVIYNSLTKADFTSGGTPTIKMEYNRGTGSVPNWVNIDSYTIPPPIKWAIGKGVKTFGNTYNLTTGTQFAALDACREVVDGSAIPVTTKA